MYVGHALLGVALGGLLARRLGAERHTALRVGLLAGAFAMVPDVDMWHTAYAVVRDGPGAIFPTTEHVWTRSWIVHRSLTHSLLTGAAGVGLAVSAAGLVHRRRVDPEGSRWSVAPNLVIVFGVCAALVAVARSSDALLGVGTVAIFAVGAVGLAVLAARRGIAPRHVGLAAAVGLFSHPFGDVWMGEPPAFFYPLSHGAPFDTVRFAADPTVNLVTLFGIEVGIAWAALAVVASLIGYSLRMHLAPHAVLGVGFAGVLPFIPPPTLDLAYQFVLGSIATGIVLGVGSTAVVDPNRLSGGPSRRLTALVTALAGVTAALAGYLVAYIVVGPP